jgi:hypothetical protein
MTRSYNSSPPWPLHGVAGYFTLLDDTVHNLFTSVHRTTITTDAYGRQRTLRTMIYDLAEVK